MSCQQMFRYTMEVHQICSKQKQMVVHNGTVSDATYNGYYTQWKHMICLKSKKERYMWKHIKHMANKRKGYIMEAHHMTNRQKERYTMEQYHTYGKQKEWIHNGSMSCLASKLNGHNGWQTDGIIHNGST